MIFFETTIGSNNYTICKIDTWSIFPTDWRQPMSLFTVLQQALFHNEQFRTPIMCDMWGSVTFCEQNPYWTKLSVEAYNFHSISVTSKIYVCIAALYINTAVSFKLNKKKMCYCWPPILSLLYYSKITSVFRISAEYSGARNENIVQNHSNIALLNVF